MIYRTNIHKHKGPALFISDNRSPENITLKNDGIEADEYGQKIIFEGTFIDKDGKAITLTKGTGLEFSADPIGILSEAVNVTDGDQGGSLMREGIIYADKLPYPEGVEYDDSFKASIEAKLPRIRCVGSQTTGVQAGAGGGGSSISFPITVAQGGTGATDAETARTNLEIDSKTNTDATKATAEAAKATAEQNKTDIQSLTERVTTLEG